MALSCADVVVVLGVREVLEITAESYVVHIILLETISGHIITKKQHTLPPTGAV